MADAPPQPSQRQWWQSAVVYQVYPRSFADSDGDGEGDLPGVRERLPYLARLGVDALWLSPFYPSPQKDSGYDVSDYRDVDPRFGTLADFDELVSAARELGIRVIVDVVPNHCSAEHARFKAALAAPPGSPEREMFVFRNADPADPTRPPNNWPSFFGGPAWTQLPPPADGSPGQWYLHLFDSSQPDWNWDNPAVHAMFDDVLRFWLDRGVAGFRVDVGNAMYKKAGLPDLPLDRTGRPLLQGAQDTPYQDQPELIPHYRHWRALLDSYSDPAHNPGGFPGQRIMVGETWADDPAVAEPWIAAGMTQSFDFRLIGARWDARVWQRIIGSAYDAGLPAGSTPWALGNHDVPRLATRLGVAETDLDTLRQSLPSMAVDAVAGLARARAAAYVLLGLPGSVYVYNGDELGLPEDLALPDSARQDPMFLRGANLGRDGCRVPLPWSADAPPYGFSTSAATWLPMPPGWTSLTVAAEEADPGSMLATYRRLVHERRSIAGPLEWLDLGPDVLAYRRGGFVCVANFGAAPVTLTHPALPRAVRLGADSATWLMP